MIETLTQGGVLLVFLDTGGRILWANRAFLEAMKVGAEASGVVFHSLLDAGSARLFQQLDITRSGRKDPLDLRHPTASGHLTIKYQFIGMSGGRIAAIGIDRTAETELIDQMSALIDDLHREIAHREELSKELERMAITDFLTGLANRRQFDKVLNDEWGRTRRYRTDFSLLLIDLDHFKSVNDRFGHQAGDEVLKEVASSIMAEVRAEDVVARYGGEEFAVIALGAKAQDGFELGERLRLKIQGRAMPASVPSMTITVGIASSRDLPPDAGLADLVASADAALYRGKQNGRNRVEGKEKSTVDS
jgi:diguanylate cyclase (GGDEF)-like protein